MVMKHHSYNGCCLLAIFCTANCMVVLLASGFVPSETVDNFTWFFLNIKTGGFNLVDYAVFSDCGKQMGPQRQLAKFGCDWLKIKNCTIHIAKKVCSKFCANNIVLQNLIFQLQATKSVSNYTKTLVENTNLYCKKIITYKLLMRILQIGLCCT
jgi:hypothetical protein